MNNLGSPEMDSMRLLHQSIFFLLFSGAIVWIMALMSFLLLAIFVSVTHVMPVYSNWGNTTSSSSWASLLDHVSSWDLWGHVFVLFIFGCLICYIALRWIYNYYIIERSHIMMRQGMFFSIEDRYHMGALQKIEVSQNMFGKIFNYGTIALFNPELDQHILLHRIPDPYWEANFIKQFCPTPGLVPSIMKT